MLSQTAFSLYLVLENTTGLIYTKIYDGRVARRKKTNDGPFSGLIIIKQEIDPWAYVAHEKPNKAILSSL